MITEKKLLTEANYLLNKIKQVSKNAEKIGALQPIETEYEQINCHNIPFLVRIINNLARKDQETQIKKKEAQEKKKNFNPFLPYDQDLFVSSISSTHLCILNKYKVIDNHLLIITREYKNQETIINENDFLAISACLNQINGLAFYNSGKIAGASVKHKHLQLVPFPIAPFSKTTPLEKVLLDLENTKDFFKLPQFEFKHSFAKIHQHDFTKEETANNLYQLYLQLLKRLDIKNQNNIPSCAYNLLLTRQWMLIVPRIKEKYQGISINSLGFAGSLLVKNKAQLNLIKQEKPLQILYNITYQI